MDMDVDGSAEVEDYPKLLGFGYNDARHAEMYSAVCEYSATLGMPVKETTMGTLTRGKFFPSDSHIEINRALGDTQKLSTILHEASRGIMQHGSDRTLSTAQVEFEADALSIMLEDKLGLPIPDARVRHLAEHFRTFTDELAVNGDVFDPEKAFKQIHKMYDIHESAMQSFFADRGIMPQESIVKLKAEPPVEQSVTLTPAAEALQTVLERSTDAEIARPKRTLGAAQDNYYRLHEIAPSLLQRHVQELQLRADGFDSLRMEWIGQNELALSHARAEYGQIFRTPEMVLRVDDRVGIIQPLSYRDDYLKVYREVGVGIDADLTLRRELNQTLNGWLKDIHLRGYRPYDRAAEINEKHHQMWQDIHRYEAATGIDRAECLVELKYDLARWQPKSGVASDQIEQRYSEAVKWAAQQPRIFVDMDGTVANFHQENNYLERMYEQGFFQGLSPYPNAVYGLQDHMIEHPYTEVYTITATVDSPYCIADKSAWLDKHLPEIDTAHRIFVPMGENKANYIPDGIRPTDILLDDYNVNLEQWRDAGGYPVKFVNDINDRGLHGERFIGDRIHYSDDPVVINTDLRKIVSDVQGAGNGAELTDDLAKWAQAHADPSISRSAGLGKGRNV